MGTICYYVPDIGFDAAEKARRLKLMHSYVPLGYEIVFCSPPEGPAFVDFEDAVLQAREAVKKHFPTIGPDDCDVVLLGEALDAVLDVVYPLARVPVVAPGEETLRLAAKAGKATGVIVMNQLDYGLARRFIERTAIKPAVVSIRSMDVPLARLLANLNGAKEIAIRVARQAAEEDGAEAIFLGAMTLNTLGLGEELRRELGIPIYDPLRIGLRIAAEVAYSRAGDAGSDLSPRQ